MILSLFQSTKPSRPVRPRVTRHNLTLEGLEDRMVMSTAAVAPLALPPIQVAPQAHVAHNKVSVPLTITGVNVTGLTTNAAGAVTGVLATVSGTLAGQTFTGVPLTIAPGATSTAAHPVLHLHLSPIDLNVLGLEVKTSDICLDITAEPGKGNLLGNLVAGLTDALNGTQSGAGLLGTLNGLIGSVTGTLGTAADVNSALNTLLTTATTGAKGAGSSSLTGLLGSALSGMKPSAASPSAPTNILHLSLGPVHLNLLGLHVDLDNCNNGPVTVDVNAIPGSGNVLGNLLAGLAHALDGPGNLKTLLANFDNSLIAFIESQ